VDVDVNIDVNVNVSSTIDVVDAEASIASGVTFAWHAQQRLALETDANRQLQRSGSRRGQRQRARS
jgi:hypothetical protein